MQTIKLSSTVKSLGSEHLGEAFKAEVESLGHSFLPLQSALCHSSHVVEENLKVIVLGTDETETTLNFRAGVFFAGVVAGSCCADDPTPMDKQHEYAEFQFVIDKQTAEASVTLL
jgi:hypothetical protein